MQGKHWQNEQRGTCHGNGAVIKRVLANGYVSVSVWPLLLALLSLVVHSEVTHCTMLLGQSNFARLVVVFLAILVTTQVFLPVEGAFEFACMEKCLKTRRCKKYGQITFDFDCDKQCKKKCYKVPVRIYLIPDLNPIISFHRSKPRLKQTCLIIMMPLFHLCDLFMPTSNKPIKATTL